MRKNDNFQHFILGLMVKYLYFIGGSKWKKEQNLGRKKEETDMKVTALGQLL